MLKNGHLTDVFFEGEAIALSEPDVSENLPCLQFLLKYFLRRPRASDRRRVNFILLMSAVEKNFVFRGRLYLFSSRMVEAAVAQWQGLGFGAGGLQARNPIPLKIRRVWDPLHAKS
ncbi:hypothetical protein AVEN_98485-1 [Araneus ventricosus]|uniref:Uncharacterized protein n=1 Tax=Araneus ventricosus TaxID=182803 RepID=A0A4Y2TPB8_ARAVE|nr:hypothetical protein AVEN_98485-1 [Araneus ventricosus]